MRVTNWPIDTNGDWYGTAEEYRDYLKHGQMARIEGKIDQLMAMLRDDKLHPATAPDHDTRNEGDDSQQQSAT